MTRNASSGGCIAEAAHAGKLLTLGILIVAGFAFFRDNLLGSEEVDAVKELVPQVDQQLLAATILMDAGTTPALATSASPDASPAPAATTIGPREPTFGFYLPVYNQIPGVLHVVRQVREFYPEAPIHLLQDGGHIDFSGICKLPAYQCTFERVANENSRWNPHSWFARMRKVAIQLGTDYLIYLEPDVEVTKRHTIHPKHDAGGMYDNYNPGMHDETAAYLETMGRERNPCFKIIWPHFGLAGGSYFRTETLIDAFAPEWVERLDWANIDKKEGDKTMSSDFAMLMALYARGWTLYPWEESAQNFIHRGLPDGEEARKKFKKQWPAYNPEAAFQHDHKEHYQDAIGKDEQQALKEFERVPETTCHGCVWYENADPAKPIPIPSKPPQEMRIKEWTYDPSVWTKKGRPKACTKEQQEAAKVGKPSVATATVATASVAPAATVPPTTEAPATTAAGNYPLPVSSLGLPIAEGPRPSWLVKQDELIVDAREEGKGGMIILQPVLMDAAGDWGRGKERPRWLRAILATNRQHAKLHKHAVVLRWMPTQPQLTDWQRKNCGGKAEKQCFKDNERENFNWEKHLMLSEYLQSDQGFTHAMLLDADAALVKHDMDILRDLAKILEDEKKDLFLTNEDWLLYGEKRINGGLVFVKNTQWARDLFQDTFDAHIQGPKGLSKWRIGVPHMQCSSNEQICLNDLLFGSGKDNFEPHTILASGIKYNRGGCTIHRCGEPVSDETMYTEGIADPRLVVLHFMGGSKHAAGEALCNGKINYTGEGPKDYACRGK